MPDLIWVVRNQVDIGVIDEVHKKQAYRHAKFLPGDRWLDAGANIGAFAVLAGQCSECVVAIEPEADNFSFLQRNLELNDLQEKTTLLWAALVPSSVTGSVDLYVHPQTGTLHRIVPVNGRRSIKAHSVHLIDVVEKYQINKIKMDIEGAELDVLMDDSLSSIFWKQIDQLLVEFHHFGYPLDGMIELDKHLTGIFSIRKGREGLPTREWSYEVLSYERT